MFKKINQVAEQVATSASRRQFLGQLGRSALAAAAAVAGVLALPAITEAARRRSGPCGNGSWIGCVARNTGDPCYGADGRFGSCQYDTIDFTPPDACECYVSGGKKPRRS